MSLDQFTTAASDYASQVDRLFWLFVDHLRLDRCLVSGLIVIFLALNTADRKMPARRGSRTLKP